MCPREDRGRRLAPQLVDRDLRVGELGEPERARLDVVADERPVLVEAGRVLLDDEGQLSRLVSLAAEVGKGRQAEGAEDFVQVRSANRRTPLSSCRPGSRPAANQGQSSGLSPHYS